MNENIILVDWFAMSYRQKGISPYEVIDSLGLRDDIQFTHYPGRYYYRDRLSFGNIHIYYNNIKEEHDFPMLEMSGQGCREFETFSKYDFDYLFSLASQPALYHMTRLDVAYDDHTGVFDINNIADDFRARNFVSTSYRGRFTDDICRNTDALSIMTGTKSSDIYMRIYDKAMERGFKDGRHWVRCELVLKQDHAVNFILDPNELGKKFRGVLQGYFRFVTPNKKDSNKARWNTREYWSDFLQDAEKINLFTKKDIDYNISRLGRYVFGQAGNSIDTYIKCVGLVKFLEELVKRDSKLTARQKYLIEQFKEFVANNETVTEATIEELQCNFRS